MLKTCQQQDQSVITAALAYELKEIRSKYIPTPKTRDVLGALDDLIEQLEADGQESEVIGYVVHEGDQGRRQQRPYRLVGAAR